MKRRLLLLCAVAVLAAGCNPVAGIVAFVDDIYRALNPPRGPAALARKTVLILPFAPLDVRGAHPNLEREVAAALIAQMKQFLPRTTLVSASALQAWQDKNPAWRGMLTPEIGRAFSADLVIEVNIARFRTRDRPGGMVLQGVLGWQARATDVASEKRVWRMGEAEARWPAEPRHFVDDISEERIKARVLARFVEQFTFRFLEEFEG